MNRPDSQMLNSNASATAAAQAFAKAQNEDKDFVPAIATGIIPPVVENKAADVKRPSPFKKNTHGPIKRPKNITNAALKAQEQEEEPEVEEVKKPEGPQIAQFMPIPVLEKPGSPFVPIGEKPQSKNGLKAPIKRPSSASINRAVAKKAEEEQDKIRQELDAAKAEEPAEQKVVAPAAPLKTSDKTFVPLAPVPFYEKKEETSPFAAPAKKTEDQLKREEEAANRALERSRSGETKKSKLGKLMDELNKPLF